MRTIPIERARRIALGAQGFCDPKPRGPVTVRHFRRALDRMTILQLDSVNVLCRSHFMPMFARLGPYDQDRLDAWLWDSGENLEYLSHEASITNKSLHPILRHRMDKPRWKAFDEMQKKMPEYLAAVAKEVADVGPLSVSDLSDPGDRKGPWWGLSKGKVALEALYISGRLSIHQRTKTFLTVYDVPERVVGPQVLALDTPSEDEAHKQMLLLGAKSHGIGTAADIADYFRIRMPLARPLIAELAASGELEEVAVPGWKDPAYLHPEAKVPRKVEARTLLTPFDPVVWFRPRAERLFDFKYRIEIYVPEPKRIYGYYVLPFLLGDRIVARVDLKADRKTGRLLAKGAYGEVHAEASEVAPALAQSLQETAQWLGLDSVQVGRRGDLSGPLRQALG